MDLKKAIADAAQKATDCVSPRQLAELVSSEIEEVAGDGYFLMRGQKHWQSPHECIESLRNDPEWRHFFGRAGESGSGLDAGNSSGSWSRANPFSSKSWDLTEQSRLYRANKSLYDSLKAEAITAGEYGPSKPKSRRADFNRTLQEQQRRRRASAKRA